MRRRSWSNAELIRARERVTSVSCSSSSAGGSLMRMRHRYRWPSAASVTRYSPAANTIAPRAANPSCANGFSLMVEVRRSDTAVTAPGSMPKMRMTNRAALAAATAAGTSRTMQNSAKVSTETGTSTTP